MHQMNPTARRSGGSKVWHGWAVDHPKNLNRPKPIRQRAADASSPLLLFAAAASAGGWPALLGRSSASPPLWRLFIARFSASPRSTTPGRQQQASNLTASVATSLGSIPRRAAAGGEVARKLTGAADGEADERGVKRAAEVRMRRGSRQAGRQKQRARPRRRIVET
ncbi:uncharacterized protein LOC133904069 [Phragmites australis]|uniref:uncharacterized protein LOC133904069 n=1 Tax=Phragmites australis TaxID=29695 RepID=UPI002D78399C|nr:uncharacterized protein LOC133904069 [Phragmites australis]